MNPQEKRLGVVVALLGAALIASLTLVPVRASSGTLSPFCLFCGDRGAIDAVLNLALFAPLGVGLRLAGLRLRSVVAVALASTLLIELLQVIAVRGRDASLGDLVWNTVGAAAGGWLASRWRAWMRPAPAGAARLARLAAAAPVAFALGGGVLLLPSLPEGRYFSQWRPPDAQSGTAHGAVLGARWNGVEIPSGPIDQSALVRARTLADALTVEATLLPLARERWLVGVLAAADERRRPLWRLSIGSGTLRLWTRSRADDWRFRSPGLLVPVAAADAPAARAALRWRHGDTLRVEARRRGGDYTLAVAVGGREARFAYRASPTRGLLLVAPLDFAAGNPSDALTLLWLAVLFAPLGYWCAIAGGDRARLRAALLLPALSLAASFLLVPPALRLAVPAPIEWGASLAGLALGALAGALVTIRRARRARQAAPRMDAEPAA